MKLKPGVNLLGVQWQLFEASIKIEPIFNSAGAELVITSGVDGKHMIESLHYKGLALDFRTRDLKDPQDILKAVKAMLGQEFDVVLEKDHLHVEFQPK